MVFRFLLVVTFIISMACSLADKPKAAKDLRFKLHSGDLMPLVGLGTYSIKGPEQVRNALDLALGAGYRHIDTAQAYHNEEDIGKALKELLPKHNLTRNDIFITSKINVSDQNPDGYKSIKESLEKLQTDYIDIYLIHHPAILIIAEDPKVHPTQAVQISKGPRNAELRDKKWQDMVKAHKEGLVRNLGVSNYGVKHLKELLANDHGVKPATNQIYWNPTNTPRDVLEFCKKEGILVVAYSSLGGSIDYLKLNLRDNPQVKKIAEKLGKTPTQVLLRWPIQEGIAIIPKASSKNHIEENIDLNFIIPDEDVQVLNNIEKKPSWFDFDNVD